MNILVIGNGFDKAHDLQTDYNDFLSFCSEFKDRFVPAIETNGVNNIYNNDNRQNVLVSNGACYYNEFAQLVNCIWIDYFQVRKDKLGNTWIDFEKEIEKTIRKLSDDNPSDDATLISEHPISNRILWNECKGMAITTYSDLFSLLNDHLKKLCRALEIYMSGVACKMTPEFKLEQIQSLKIDKLLSFNYTETYLNKYDPDCKVEYEYIHGRASIDSSLNECDLILGFDDTYSENAPKRTDVIPFEKYYQRIINRTGNKVYDWISEINQSESKNIVYFYGHSLSVMDGDIIRKLILSRNTHTIIYYLNEKDRAQKVLNLAQVLGRTELIKVASGKEPIVTFAKITNQKYS